MPRVLDAPRRDVTAGAWGAANCAYAHTDVWRSNAPEQSWERSRARSGRMTPRTAQVALEVQFEDLADEWQSSTAFESVVTRKSMHPAYQRIIGMGDDAVPLILRRLRREPHQWFWALSAITGQDPAAGLDRPGSAAEAWLEWGRARGLVVD